MKLVNFNDLLDWGLVDKINNDILHPLGLKLIIKNGKSPGCLISDTLNFPNSDEQEVKRKYELFLKNRYYLLKNYLDVREYQKTAKKELDKKIIEPQG